MLVNKSNNKPIKGHFTPDDEDLMDNEDLLNAIDKQVSEKINADRRDEREKNNPQYKSVKAQKKAFIEFLLYENCDRKEAAIKAGVAEEDALKMAYRWMASDDVKKAIANHYKNNIVDFKYFAISAINTLYSIYMNKSNSVKDRKNAASEILRLLQDNIKIDIAGGNNQFDDINKNLQALSDIIAGGQSNKTPTIEELEELANETSESTE